VPTFWPATWPFHGQLSIPETQISSNPNGKRRKVCHKIEEGRDFVFDFVLNLIFARVWVFLNFRLVFDKEKHEREERISVKGKQKWVIFILLLSFNWFSISVLFKLQNVILKSLVKKKNYNMLKIFFLILISTDLSCSWGAKDIYKRYPKGKEREENKLNIQTQGFIWLRPRTTRRRWYSTINRKQCAEVLEKLSALTRHNKYSAGKRSGKTWD
jgi:hypothetical protein